jgi:hypothetical protein
LGNDREISRNTTAVTGCTATVGKSTRGTVFSVWFLPRCYKQDSWSSELVMGWSSADMNVNTEAEDIVEIRHQATIGEETTD